MTDFGRRAGDMFRSVYDCDLDGVIAIGQTEADMKKSAYDANANSVVDNSEKLSGSTKTQVQDHTPKTHTHTESQISDLDHDALKIKGVIVNDAAIGDQKVLAYDLGTTRLVYISQAPSGAALNSIQTGELDITGVGVFTDTVTINSVDVDKTMLILGGIRSDSNNEIYGFSRIELTNATTITSYRGADHALHALATFSAVEFSSGIKSIQSGSITMTTTENTDTISEVDTSKAFVIYLGASATNTDWANIVCTLELTNGTTVTCKCTQLGYCIVGYMVVEFD